MFLLVSCGGREERSKETKHMKTTPQILQSQVQGRMQSRWEDIVNPYTVTSALDGMKLVGNSNERIAAVQYASPSPSRPKPVIGSNDKKDSVSLREKKNAQLLDLSKSASADSELENIDIAEAMLLENSQLTVSLAAEVVAAIHQAQQRVLEADQRFSHHLPSSSVVKNTGAGSDQSPAVQGEVSVNELVTLLANSIARADNEMDSFQEKGSEKECVEVDEDPELATLSPPVTDWHTKEQIRQEALRRVLLAKKKFEDDRRRADRQGKPSPPRPLLGVCDEHLPGGGEEKAANEHEPGHEHETATCEYEEHKAMSVVDQCSDQTPPLSPPTSSGATSGEVDILSSSTVSPADGSLSVSMSASNEKRESSSRRMALEIVRDRMKHRREGAP